MRAQGASHVSRIALMALVSAPALAEGRGQYMPQSVMSAEMGRCALRRDRETAVAFVSAKDKTASDRAMSHLKPALTACLKQRPSATLSGFHLSGGVAEALLSENGGALLTRLASLAPRAPIRVKDGAERFGAVPQAPTVPSAYEEVVWLESIDCAVAAAPDEAAALLRAEPATPEEMAAFQRLAPMLQACVPATGSVRIKRDRVRPAVAWMSYRRVSTQGSQNSAALSAADGSN